MNAAISPGGLSIEAEYLLTRMFIRSIVNANFQKGVLLMNMRGIITVNTTANIVNHVRTITAGMKSRIREEQT